MLGLDSHDMEDIMALVKPPNNKENLRFSEVLQPGYVITVEPGVYFIPPLIDEWASEGRCADFICYDEVEKFKDFGGIRIEDDLLITDGGARVLGPKIDK
jgi:Xaa-Pro aminopeptidase